MIGLLCNAAAAFVNLIIWSNTGSEFALAMAGLSMLIGLGFAVMDRGF